VKEFIHYKTHSQYSICEGAVKINELAEYCKKNKIIAAGISDTNNLSGALEFSNALAKAGTQPVIGNQLNIKLNFNNQYIIGKISIIAKDAKGYENMLHLSSKSYLELKENEEINCSFEDLVKFSEGLIILAGGANSLIYKLILNNNEEQVDLFLNEIKKKIKKDLFIEIQRHKEINDNLIEKKLLFFSNKLSIPIIATHEVFYIEKDMYEAHDAYICVGEKTYVNEKKRLKYSPEHYLKSSDEMKLLFKDLPDALTNNFNLIKKIKYFPKKCQPLLPNLKDNNINLDLAIKEQAYEGLKYRLENFVFKNITDENHKNSINKLYNSRLKYELEMIINMKFAGYFLIVSDYVKWAKKNSIPVGPGRGSGAGSLVAWCLSITDLDPIRFGLIFERFLNPDRISMPDFDIDFCQEGRDSVINYVKDKYQNKVAQIITFGKLQARMALRDIGRVIGLPYGRVDQLCKMIPFDPSRPLSLAESIAIEPRILQAQKEDQNIKKLINYSLKLEGLYRNIATHAAGIVIGDKDLKKIVPLYKDLSSNIPIPVTQFDMKSSEDAGLVKFDLLGLKTLTVIKKAVNFIKKDNPNFDISKLNLNDQETFDLLSSGETMGIFQLESSGMREVLKQLKPNKFEDIIALVALYRPGPMQNIPTYINRKHDKEKIDYIHPTLKTVLKETYGVIIYQEQVMQIAQTLSNFSASKADILRKAMGKKKSAEMERQKKDFIEGAIKNRISKDQAIYIFQLVEKFAQYGFNKSHAAAYALIAYQTAYLKMHYPIYFFCASMNTELSNTDKLNLFYEELKKLKLKILPPCINNSYSEFLPNKKEEIYYALSAIKAVGYDSISKIVLERETNGKYKNLNDFLSRNSSKNLNKLQLEGLIKAGAFDCLEKNRRKIYESVPDLIKASKTSEVTSNNLNLFAEETTSQVINLNNVKQWKESEIIEKEFESIGFFVSEHPLKNHIALLDDLKVITYKDFKSNSKLKTCVLSGTLMKLQEKKTARGSPYAIAKFTDLSQMFELFLFSENLIDNRQYLKVGNSFIINTKKDLAKDGTERINVTRVFFIENLIPKDIKEINIYVDSSNSIKNLKNYLKKQQGSTIVNLKYKRNNFLYNFRLSKTRKVNYDDIKYLKSAGIDINIKN
tara:strand:+ start:8777 stop:12187 length:3411 start_codon:yes stop_codon:yes gene_type:complete